MKNLVLKSILMVAALVCCMACEKDGDVRDVYVGSFRIKQQAIVDGVVVEDNYNITIVKSSVNSSDIIINNILKTGESVNATINNGTNFTIPQQTISDAGVSGSGRIDGAYIRFSVMVTGQFEGQLNFTCEGPKQ
jgi:hypothetical protein